MSDPVTAHTQPASTDGIGPEITLEECWRMLQDRTQQVIDLEDEIRRLRSVSSSTVERWSPTDDNALLEAIEKDVSVSLFVWALQVNDTRLSPTKPQTSFVAQQLMTLLRDRMAQPEAPTCKHAEPRKMRINPETGGHEYLSAASAEPACDHGYKHGHWGTGSTPPYCPGPTSLPASTPSEPQKCGWADCEGIEHCRDCTAAPASNTREEAE